MICGAIDVTHQYFLVYTIYLDQTHTVAANFLYGNFSPLISDACQKSSHWLWKEKFCQDWCGKARKHIYMCVTNLTC